MRNHDEQIVTPEAPPPTLAGAIRLALKDAERVRCLFVDDDPTARIYRPHAAEWHQGCNVCLAGMVIARLVHFDQKREVEPAQFNRQWQRALTALEHVRTAHWERAAHQLWNTDDERRYDSAACERFERLVNEGTAGNAFGPLENFVGWNDFDRFTQRLNDTVLPAVEAAERIVRE